jgi:hypothetical protein
MRNQEIHTDDSETQPDHLSAVSSTQPELQAQQFFSSILIFNNILSSSVRKTPPSSTNLYHRRLSSPTFAHAVQSATGCQAWILLRIMDATSLEKWKAEQERQGNLSVRELVKRAAELEAAVEDGIKTLSSLGQHSTHDTTTSSNRTDGWSDAAQTSIFAHALLTHIHTIVSGALSGVPEIRQSIDRTIRAWESPSLSRTRPRPMLRSLAWPYCVSASLASGAQRDVFRELASSDLPSSALGLGIGGVVDYKAVVEACWREEDGKVLDREVSVDWRGTLTCSNTSFLFL